VERVEIVVEGRKFAAWSEVEITLSLDTFSTIRLVAPFEPERKEFRDVFRPFEFQSLKVTVGGRPLFTGTVLCPYARADAKSRSVEVTGYALPGVLQDCPLPGDQAREFKKLGLRAITEQLAKPFGLTVTMGAGADEGTKFDKVKIEEGERVFDFVAMLARQRDLVVSNTPEGALLLWRSVELGDPVVILVEGEPPLSRVTAEFNPQEYYSEITGFACAKRGRAGAKHREPNPWLTKMRPFTFRLEDTEKADTAQATRARLGRMFANAAAYTVEDLPTWRDPNTTMKLTAPSAMIYRRSEFLIRHVTLKQSKLKESCDLGLVLPGSFTGKTPAFLPWGEAPRSQQDE
jgi:prophage tail gpP-like protein